MHIDVNAPKPIFPLGLLRGLRPGQTQLLFQKLLYACFYRYLFGTKTSLAGRLANKIASWEKLQGRGDIPISQEAWEAQYVGAQWSYLDQLEELSRYSVVAGYVQCFSRGGSILDVGCGEGILVQRLNVAACKSYVGIDISQTAIDKAAKKANRQIFFLQADAQEFVSGESFDAIIFNEVLYYMDQPLDVVQRYEAWLKPGGVFISSLFENSRRAVAISGRIKERYNSIAEVRMSTQSAAWIINIFAPRTSSPSKCL